MLFSALTLSAQSGVDWETISWIGSTDANYNNKFKCSTTEGLVNIQHPGFASEIGIYMTFPAAGIECNLTGISIQGAGMIMHLSAFTTKETEVVVNYAGGSRTFWVYYADGTEGGTGEGGEEPDPTPDPEEPEVTDKWASLNWLGNGSGLPENTDKYKISQNCLQEVVNIQKPGWADEPGIYVVAPGAIESCSVNGAIQGGGMVLYLSSFTAKETEVTINYAGGSCTFWVYYADGIEGGSDTPATPSEVYDVNFALTDNGSSAEATSGNATAAIDNNAGTRWESAQTDPQTWTLDLGQLRIFNTLEIVWEGAYGKTFTVSASDDKETWTPIWTVEGQELAGFPYTQTQKIDKTTARYIQFHGTARGTGYGYSFWEFRVYLAGESTFTSLEATPTTNLSKVGEGNAITLTAKDQNGKTMTDVGEVTYTITPFGAGTITNNVYTPARIGLASIIATIGEVSAPAFEVFAYDGENVALSPDINNSKIIAQSEFAPNGTDAWHAIDGNEGSVWQGSATNGTAGDEAARTYDSWFVVDFGAEYDVNLVSIKFEGACSQEYHVDFSADNATWSLAYNYVGNAGVNGHTKLIYGTDLQNATKVRYARFYSTKAATEWGMKIYEFKVFGTESATLTKTVSASVNDAAMGTATVTQNGVAVTEVETGSEVTFTAIANEGYAFVNWSNGNTNPSFTTTIDAAMHLTANFRALGTVYCNTPMTVDGHTIYVTMKRTAPENYALIVRSEENLTNFGGTVFYMPTNALVVDLRNKGVLSDDKHTLTGTFTAEKVPYMTTPLYVVFEGIGEKTYQQLTNIEYDVECEDDMTVTGLALDPASVSIMVGGSQTLKAIFTPAHAFGEELEWISSNDAVATVDANGVVKAVAVGNAVITAKLVSNPSITATCNVIVTNFTAHTFYGYGSQNDVDFAYNLTYNEDGTITIVADVLTNNPGLGVPSFNIDGEWENMTKNADGTYTRTSQKTFSMGQEINCFLYAPYTGGVGQLDFNYIVGSENTRPEIPIASVTINHESLTLTPNNTIQLSSIIAPLTTTANKEINWSSSNNAVVTVDANGVVKAIAVGDAVITATLVSNPSFTATCNVIVTAFTAHTFYGYGSNGGVDFAYNLTYNEDGTVTVVAEVLTNKGTLGYNQSFSIDGDWKDMTKNPDGTYTRTSEKTFSMGQEVPCFFYAPIEGGGAGRIEFTYIVGSENTRPSIPVTGVSINHESITFTVGETIQLSGAVTPMTANNKTVTWKSSNEAVATVVDGLVTAIAPGDATITIASAEGNYRATCSIKVLAAISELPPAPIWHKSQVKAIYSATYDADCDFGEWNSGTIYTQDTYGKKFTTNTTGYFGLVGFAYDCTDMQYLHLDVWCANSTSLGIVPIHGGAEVRVTQEIIGGQWNAIEIPLTAYEGVTNWSNVTQLKIDQIKEQNIWLNNIYFYKELHQEVTESLEITEDYAYTSLTITEDGMVTISNGATLIVKDFVIQSTMGAGESGQLLGATLDNFDLIGDAYIDITLGKDAAADQWHAFTVPFPVNALNGIYKTDGTKLRNEVDYAIMDYHGDIRANGKYGWKKYRGDLVPGTFYIMTVNGDIKTFRFKKTDGSSVVAANNKALIAHNGSGTDTDKGWNGVGNPTLAYGSVAQAVQVLNPETYTYETHEANATNFTVGTPFFIQAAANGSMIMADANASNPSYAPARQQTTDVKAKVYLSNENYTDRLYITATDDAAATYEIGKDLVKMTMTNTPNVPQLFARAYNTDLCMIHTPLSNNEAMVALNLYAPATGEYTLSAEAQNGETIYLLKDNAIIWNLTASEYTIDLSQGNTEVYGVIIKRAPQVETGVDNGATIQTLPSKVILQGNLYIFHNGQVYDATGKCVK